mgnify:CR=1 FL=1
MLTRPSWLMVAQRYLGLREIPGAPTEPTIAGWLRKLRAWWADDETPWCGTYVAACLSESGYPVARHWYRAKGWLDWGVPIAGPAVGAVVVFDRQGGGHVGFVVGRDSANRLLVLGGNQGNAVSVATFDLTARPAAGYRWPGTVPIPSVGIALLPTQVAHGAASTNEA